MRKPRENDAPVDEVAILRRHPIDRVPPCASWRPGDLVAPITQSCPGFSEQSSCCLAAP
jgi:hypothetical protein